MNNKSGKISDFFNQMEQKLEELQLEIDKYTKAKEETVYNIVDKIVESVLQEINMENFHDPRTICSHVWIDFKECCSKELNPQKCIKEVLKDLIDRQCECYKINIDDIKFNEHNFHDLRAVTSIKVEWFIDISTIKSQIDTLKEGADHKKLRFI